MRQFRVFLSEIIAEVYNLSQDAMLDREAALNVELDNLGLSEALELSASQDTIVGLVTSQPIM